MLSTINTLFRSVAAEAEEAVIDRHALTLLDQKIRDTAPGIAAAKQTLAGLIRRERLENQQLELIQTRISDLEPRIEAALTPATTGSPAPVPQRLQNWKTRPQPEGTFVPRSARASSD